MTPELSDVAARELTVVFLAADASMTSVLYAVNLVLVPCQTPFR